MHDICYLSSNNFDDKYVGIKFLDDDIKIYFPLGYNIPDEDSECRKSIISLLKNNIDKKINYLIVI
ncbi:MAG: hypothetical protein L6V81_10180 [Clostridium sp.]|nr:MAG: hypothetical protein L6V81_10180 [Clostridium sp.]